MTPQQKLKHAILLKMVEWGDKEIPADLNAENIDTVYDETEEKWDAISEVRCSGEDTGLPCEWSRHYESTSVAAVMPDGSWVGWTYWYGGGKHGEPEAIDWISGAYNLECTEEEKVVTVRTFTRTE